MAAFARAAAEGDLDALTAVLDPEVTLTSDGGGLVSAARHPVPGADRVARLLIPAEAAEDELKGTTSRGPRVTPTAVAARPSCPPPSTGPASRRS